VLDGRRDGRKHCWNHAAADSGGNGSKEVHFRIHNSGGRKGGTTLAVVALVLGCLEVVFALLAGLAMPVILRAKKKADTVQAMSNLRQVGALMYQFDQDWGTFPSQKIRTDNPDKFPGVSGGDDANAYLSMLIAGGYTQAEDLFYAKGGSRAKKKPDNVISPPNQILEAGECGFGYVMLADGKAMSSADNSGRPLLVAPLVAHSSGANPDFNIEPFDQKAIYLRLDQSIQQARINKSTKHVTLPGLTMTLFDTGERTVWGTTDVPDVKAPK